MASPPRTSEQTIGVAVVRNTDLEARELAVYDWMDRNGLTNTRAFGTRPDTPYGLDGLGIPIATASSVMSVLGRIPFGRTLGSIVEERSGRSLAKLPGFAKQVGDADVINPRETYSAQAVQSIRLPRDKRAKVVVSVAENIPFAYEADRLLAGTKEFVRAKADLFIANSPEAASALRIEGIPGDRIVHVPLPVDTERFTPGDHDSHLRERWGVGRDDFVVLYAGRLIHEKGLINLVLAFERLCDRRGDVQLVFNGSGPERARLERAVAARDLATRIHFAPWVPTLEMPKVYRSADLVVLPSLSTPYWLEQFGYNLAEAMACGRPILTSSSGSIPGTVGDAAALFDDYSIESLAWHLQSLVADDDARADLAQRAVKRARSEYAFEIVGPQLHDAFEHSLSLPSRAP